MGKTVYGYIFDGFDVILSWFNVFMRLFFGPFLAIACNLLVTYVVWAYCIDLMPSIIISDLEYIIHIFLAIYFCCNIYGNYLSCIFTPPGTPGKLSPTEEEFWNTGVVVKNQRYTRRAFSYTIEDGVTFRFCRKCDILKPPRAHHCSVLGRCVYEMDHYCPWMSNTIGKFNYKYFILFLFHFSTGCGYMFYILQQNYMLLTPTQM